MPAMTKAELRVKMKALAAEMEGWTRYERSEMVTLPKKVIDRVRQRWYDLSEEEVLWT